MEHKKHLTECTKYRGKSFFSGKITGNCLLVGIAIFWAGCTKDKDTFMDALKNAEKVTYYDRNGDGKVDAETHRFEGGHDMNWALRDDNYDGRYEKRIRYGVGVSESAVDRPVPTNVPIEPKS